MSSRITFAKSELLHTVNYRLHAIVPQLAKMAPALYRTTRPYFLLTELVDTHCHSHRSYISDLPLQQPKDGANNIEISSLN